MEVAYPRGVFRSERTGAAFGLTAGDTFHQGLRGVAPGGKPHDFGLPVDTRAPDECPGWRRILAKAKADIENKNTTRQQAIASRSFIARLLSLYTPLCLTPQKNPVCAEVSRTAGLQFGTSPLWFIRRTAHFSARNIFADQIKNVNIVFRSFFRRLDPAARSIITMTTERLAAG